MAEAAQQANTARPHVIEMTRADFQTHTVRYADGAAAHATAAHASGAGKTRPSAPATKAASRSSSTNPAGSLAYRVGKRAFDVAFSAAVIAVSAVPGALLAAAIARETGAAPIYTQERVGKGGKPFRMYKFRSMVADADDVEKHLNPTQLAQWARERKVDDDPRVTPIGRVIRATSVDEFPQFVNALLGQMSVVGPRAITREELTWFGADADELLSVRPGITGLWQTGPRNEYDFESGRRQALELRYVRTRNALLDAKLVVKTVGAMLQGTGR